MHNIDVMKNPSRRWSRGMALALLIGIAGTGSTASAAQAKTVTIFVGRSEHMSLPWRAKGASLTDPAIADVQILTPELLLVTGKSVGSTNVLVWSETGQTLEARVEVNADLSRLTKDLAQLFPKSGIQVTQSQSAVILSGPLERAEQADSLHRYLEAQKVNFVDMTSLAGVQQVQVQVRMAEVSRVALRSLGFNGVIAGSDAFGGSNIGGINPSSIVPPPGAPATGNIPFEHGITTVSPSVTLFGGLTRGDLEVFVRALADNQYLHILADPTLVAMSGAEASFLSGGEVPIPVVQSGGTGGSGSISIQFKPFGISLKFRPTVLGEGGIRLEVFSEVSEPTEGIVTQTSIGPLVTPGFNTRRAQTTVELKSGQSFAMAGLLSEKVSAQSTRVPGLGDLPILGALFRSVQYRKGETELLVIVTANLVEPVSDLSMPPMPGESHVAPTDWQLYVGGRLEGNVPPRVGADDSEWMKEMGLDRLKGPGAWMSYGQPPAVSTARSSQRAPKSAAPAPSGSSPPDDQPKK